MIRFSQVLPDLTSTLPQWAGPLNAQIADRLRLARADIQTAAAVGHGAIDVAGQAYAMARRVGASAIVNHPGGGYTTHHVSPAPAGALMTWRPGLANTSRPPQSSAPLTRFAVIHHSAPGVPVSGGGLYFQPAPAFPTSAGRSPSALPFSIPEGYIK